MHASELFSSPSSGELQLFREGFDRCVVVSTTSTVGDMIGAGVTMPIGRCFLGDICIHVDEADVVVATIDTMVRHAES